MQLSQKLKKLVSVVEDVQLELRQIKRELDRIDDEELEGLIVDWERVLERLDVHLEEASDIMWGLAKEMEEEGL
jgi:hypothetical protein